MSLPLVTLRLKGSAEPPALAAAREVKPRVAAPPSEDLEAADALRGLFAAAPSASAPTAASAQSKRVLKMVRPRPATRPPPRPPPPTLRPLRPRAARPLAQPSPSRTQAKQQPRNYKLSDGQLDGILQLARASPLPAAPQAPAAPPSTIQFEQLRTTLWDRVAKKRVPATSYQGDMQTHLAANPHLEIYNRQDRMRPAGQTLMAGMHVPTFAPSATSSCNEHLKVVLWHVVERRKLSRDESPTQGELCRFLQANPCIAVYEGQQAPAPSPHSAPEAPLKPAPTKPAAITMRPLAMPRPAVAAGELLQLAKGITKGAKAPRAKPAKKAGVRWKTVVALQPACSRGVPDPP